MVHYLFNMSESKIYQELLTSYGTLIFTPETLVLFFRVRVPNNLFCLNTCTHSNLTKSF